MATPVRVAAAAPDSERGPALWRRSPAASVGRVPEWSDILPNNAAAYAKVAIGNIGREFPSGVVQPIRDDAVVSAAPEGAR
jgi:hypothetical protein